MRVYKNKDFEHEALRSLDDDSESQEISSTSTIEQSNLRTAKYLAIIREKRAIYILSFTAFLCSVIITSTILAIYFYHGNSVSSDANFPDYDVRTVYPSSMEQEGMCNFIVVSDYTYFL